MPLLALKDFEKLPEPLWSLKAAREPLQALNSEIELKHQFPLEIISVGGRYTTFYLRSLKLLIDAGSIQSPYFGADKIFLTHGHLDHSRDLSYLLSQRSFMYRQFTQVWVPFEILERVQAVIKANEALEEGQYLYQIQGYQEGQEISLGQGYYLLPFKARHVVPCYGLELKQRRRKILPEGKNLDPAELRRLKKENPNQFEALFFDFTDHILLLSSDTQEEVFEFQKERFLRSRFHLLECTFWDSLKNQETLKQWGHLDVFGVARFYQSILAQLPADFNLLLYHLSSRYEPSLIWQTAQEVFSQNQLSQFIHINF